MRRWTLMTLILFSLVSLSIMSSAQTQYFAVEVDTIENSIIFGEFASYDVTFTNKRDKNITFSLAVSGDWDATFSENKFSIGPGSSKEIELRLQPRSSTGLGEHQVSLLTSSEGNTLETLVRVNYFTLEPDNEVSILPSSQVPRTITPGELFSATVVVENKLSKELKNVEIKLSSDEFIAGSKKVNLAPYEKKVVEFEIEVPLSAYPRNTVVNIRVVRDDEILNSDNFPIEILSLTPSFESEIREDKQFLKRKATYFVHNVGNVALKDEFKVPVNFLTRMFVDAQGADYIQGNYVWSFELKGDEVKEVVVLYNYRSLLVILMIFLILLGLYHYIKPEIFLTKTFSNVKFNSEGKFEGARVVITMKNKSGQTITGININETLPEFVMHDPSEVHGSIKPASVNRLVHTTKIIWNVSEMAPGEERIVIYNVRPKYSVVDTLRIPATVITFNKGGSLKTIYSNNLVANPPLRELQQGDYHGES